MGLQPDDLRPILVHTHGLWRDTLSAPPPPHLLLAPVTTQGVKDSPELRAAVEEVQPENVALGLRLGQSQPLYKAYKVRGKGGGGGLGWVEWRRAHRHAAGLLYTSVRKMAGGMGVGTRGKAAEEGGQVTSPTQLPSRPGWRWTHSPAGSAATPTFHP